MLNVNWQVQKKPCWYSIKFPYSELNRKNIYGLSSTRTHASLGSLAPIVFVFDLATTILSLVVVVLKFEHITDGFGIKKAITRAAYWTFPLSGIIFTADIVPGIVPDALAYGRFVESAAISITLNGLIAIFLNFPVWQSYTSHKRESDMDSEFQLVASKTETSKMDHPHRQSGIPLQSILHIKRYASDLEDFKKHLVSEFSSESLIFYFRVHQFQDFVKTVALKQTPDNISNLDAQSEHDTTLEPPVQTGSPVLSRASLDTAREEDIPGNSSLSFASQLNRRASETSALVHADDNVAPDICEHHNEELKVCFVAIDFCLFNGIVPCVLDASYIQILTCTFFSTGIVMQL